MTTARAIVERDFRGVRLAVSPGGDHVYLWPQSHVVKSLDEGTGMPSDAWLPLTEDTARAIYEALAEHFGLVGSTALLKAQNESLGIERGRVDKLIGHLVD